MCNGVMHGGSQGAVICNIKWKSKRERKKTPHFVLLCQASGKKNLGCPLAAALVHVCSNAWAAHCSVTQCPRDWRRSWIDPGTSHWSAKPRAEHVSITGCAKLLFFLFSLSLFFFFFWNDNFSTILLGQYPCVNPTPYVHNLCQWYILWLC